MDTNNKLKYEHITQLEAVKRIDMYAGMADITNMDNLVINEDNTEITTEKFMMSTALVKVFWEVISNCLDEFVRNPRMRFINFDCRNNEIIIENHGCIPIELVNNAHGKEMYLPTMLFSEFHASSNFDKKEEYGNEYTGGVNGLGVKLTNAWSKYLEVEIFDKKSKQYFFQRFENQMEIINEPIVFSIISKRNDLQELITDLKNNRDFSESYVRVKFKPAYKALGFKTRDVYKNIERIIKVQAYMTKAFTMTHATGLPPSIKWNGELLDPNFDFESLVRMFGNDECHYIKCIMKHSKKIVLSEDIINKSSKKLNPWWEIIFVLHSENININDLSIINGIYSMRGGDHIKYIYKLLNDKFEKKITTIITKTSKERNPRAVLQRRISVMVCGLIPIVRFDAQRKDYICVPDDKLQEMSLAPMEYKKIWDQLEPSLLNFYMDEKVITVKNSKSIITGVKDFEDARRAGSKDKFKTSLFLCEGKSASKTVSNVIHSSKISAINSEYYGVFAITASVNVRKETTIIEKKNVINNSESKDIVSSESKDIVSSESKDIVSSESKDNTTEKLYIPNNKLRNSQRINDLYKVLNLNWDCKYNTQAERNTLRYGSITLFVDEDLDGVGKIGPLIVNNLYTFFPGLGKIGFIKRFETPIVRIFFKNKSVQKVFKTLESKNKDPEIISRMSADKKYLSFYNEESFINFIERYSNYTSGFDITYYKGLGTHKNDETIDMCRDFENHLFTYILDPQGDARLEAYFGKDSDIRKEILSGEHVYLIPPNIFETIYSKRSMNVSEMLDYNVQLFHRETLVRSIPCALDGFTDSRRKIVSAIRKRFGCGNNKTKVSQFAGYVSDNMQYHHGEASLHGTISLLAKPYCAGGCMYPLLQPHGKFGSVRDGTPASPRYIFVNGFMDFYNLLLPKIDDDLLPNEIIDGEVAEKRYYIPIIPLSIMERNQLIATGWSVNLTPRKLNDVIENIKLKINDAASEVKEMGPDDYWYEDCKFLENSKIIIGNYEWLNPTTIRITKLPPGVFSSTYCENLENKIVERNVRRRQEEKKNRLTTVHYRGISEIIDDSSPDDGFKIIVYFRAVEDVKIIESDARYKDHHLNPIEKYLKLGVKIHDQINYSQPDGTVLDNTTYEHVFEIWFKARKELYIQRVSRQKIYLQINIEICQNRIRFLEMIDQLNFKHKSKDEIISLLSEHKFEKFNEGLLDNLNANIPLENLYTYLKTHEVCFKYLLGLTIEKQSRTEINKIKTKQSELEDQLNYLKDPNQNFIGERVWLQELDNIIQIIQKHRVDNWEPTGLL